MGKVTSAETKSVDDGEERRVVNDIGRRIKWMGEVLRNGAEKEIKDYQRRFSAASSLYNDVLSPMLMQSLDDQGARGTAREFFGSERVRLLADIPGNPSAITSRRARTALLSL